MKNTIDYHAYIRSPEWKAKAKRIKIARGWICAGCGECFKDRPWLLDAHHTPQAYKDMPNERDEDIVLLCRGPWKCHRKGNITKREIAKDRRAVSELRIINAIFDRSMRLLWWILRKTGYSLYVLGRWLITGT